ncbi:MAG: FHA domain-containing protein [Kineosporiaceae bacterium]
MTGDAVYAPGSALAALSGRTLVVWVPRGDIDPSRMWDAVRGGSVPELLETLCGDLSFSRLPSFAVAVREPDGVRVLVRGDLQVGVGTPPTSVSARGASTWVETVVPGPGDAAVDVLVPGAAVAAAGEAFPLVAGIVAAAQVSWAGDGSSAGAPPAPEVAVEARPGIAVRSVPAAADIAGPVPVPVHVPEPVPPPAPVRAEESRITEDTLTEAPPFEPFDAVTPADEAPVVSDDTAAQSAVDAGRDAEPEAQGDDRAGLGEPIAEASVSYEYLHGARSGRSVAAARSLDDLPDDPLVVPPAEAPAPLQASAPAPAPVTHPPAAAPVPQPLPPVAQAPAQATPPQPAPSGGLITGSPWALAGGAPSLAAPPAPAAVVATARAAAPPASVQASVPPAPGADRLGDHDDLTIARSDATFRREAARRVPTGPEVLGVLCPAGHPNSPASATCRLCGADVPEQEPEPMPRPDLGTLRLSTGQSVVLDRPVILGRAPRAQGRVGELPQLLTLSSPEQEISSSHLELRIEGWQVFAVDLDSLNGTVVTLPGRAPVRLRAQSPVLIVPGTTIDLPDDVVATFEVGP